MLDINPYKDNNVIDFDEKLLANYPETYWIIRHRRMSMEMMAREQEHNRNMRNQIDKIRKAGRVNDVFVIGAIALVVSMFLIFG